MSVSALDQLDPVAAAISHEGRTVVRPVPASAALADGADSFESERAKARSSSAV
jgi:hypothetical protein